MNMQHESEEMRRALVAIGVDIVARSVFWQRDCYHLVFRIETFCLSFVIEGLRLRYCQRITSDFDDDDGYDDLDNFDDDNDEDDDNKYESHPSPTRWTVVA